MWNLQISIPLFTMRVNGVVHIVNCAVVIFHCGFEKIGFR